jgi:hypothetical protein
MRSSLVASALVITGLVGLGYAAVEARGVLAEREAIVASAREDARQRATETAREVGEILTRSGAAAELSDEVVRVLVERVPALRPTETGYAMLATGDGRVVHHPVATVAKRRPHVDEVANAQQKALVKEAFDRLRRGEGSRFATDNQISGQHTWFFVEPIPGTDHAVVLARIAEEVRLDPVRRRRGIVRAAIAGIIGAAILLALTAAAIFRKRRRARVLWIWSFACAALLLGGTALIRQVVHREALIEDEKQVAVVDAAGVEAALGATRGRRTPVGIAVRSLEITGPGEAVVSGVLWQRFDSTSDGNEPPGLTFVDASRASLQQAYRRREGAVEIVGWRFSATLRQRIDPRRYPLDHGHVSLRLAPSDQSLGVVLVPDFAVYPITSPSARPGLAPALRVPGWTVESSSFAYAPSELSSVLGGSSDASDLTAPELRFRIELRRGLLNPLVTLWLPMLLVLSLLFVVVLTASWEKERSDLFGFNPAGVIRLATGFFFVVLVAHIHLRNSLEADELVFMEWCYITVYLVLVLVSVHALLLKSERVRWRWLRWEDGLAVKLGYWPLVFGLQLAVTLAYFF